MSPLRIELAGLHPGLNHVQLEAEPGEVDLDPAQWRGSVRADLDVEKTGERLGVRGHLSATAALDCVRCLETFELPLRVPFEVFAERAGTGSRREEAELERDRYMQFHDGRQLDLTVDAHDALLLEIPMAPHCREDCKGLCPRCGANLNEGPCACDASAAGA